MINNKIFLSFLSKLAEVYPIGHVKYAPGTLASIVATFFGYHILIFFNIKFFLLFVFFFIILSYFLCEAHIRVYKKKDPKENTANIMIKIKIIFSDLEALIFLIIE